MLNINKIEKERKYKGFKLDYFAKEIGITPTTYINLKNSGDFRIKQIEAISKLLELPLSELFENDNFFTYQNAEGTNITQVNDGVVKYGNGTVEKLKSEIKDLKKEVKYLKEINELLKQNLRK